MENTNFKLTDKQINFFKTFGFLRFPGLMSDRIEEIDEAFESIWETHGGGHHGKPHNEKARSCIVRFIDQSEVLSALLDDPRILGLATGLLGNDFNYMGSDGNYYVGDTRWHSDGRHPEILHIKIAFYLDRLTPETGALRVIPGSQGIGDRFAENLQDQVRASDHNWGIGGADVPSFAFENGPGDLLCFNHNTKHAAFGGGIRRRMFTINLSQCYPENRLEDLRSYLAKAARFWIDRKYGEIMVRTAGPERMRHLEQVMANDGHLAELSRKAREEMTEPARG